jgi:acyl carrier protein
MSPTDRARAILAEALEVDVAQLPADASVVTMREWDSLAHLRLIEVIERELSGELPPEMVVAIGSLDDVVRVITERALV